MAKERYDKLTVAMRYWLLGKGFFRTLEAMEFGRRHHTGTRKDGIIPEFQHQLEIMSHCRTLQLMDMELVLTAIPLHDVVEDCNVDIEEIGRLFGKDVQNVVWLLTKEYRGVKKSMPEYFRAISEDPHASIGKGTDRVNNMGSMVGVFTQAGQAHYVREVKELFFPMLKTARRKFPQQEAAYENIKLILENQVRLVEAIHQEMNSKASEKK